MSKEITAALAEMVRKNTTENQRETLVEMGLIGEHGLLNIKVVDLQKAEEAPLPMGDQQAVRIKGRVEAHIGLPKFDISLFKDKGGRVFADSNIKGGKNPTTGKRWTTYIPNFGNTQQDANAARYSNAWTALEGILPAYLTKLGVL